MAVKQFFRYIHGTDDYGLLNFDSTMDNILKGYCDFNFVGDQNDCKSCTSYVCTIANAIISWTNKHQGYTSLSTTKAMYVATCVVTKDAI